MNDELELNKNTITIIIIATIFLIIGVFIGNSLTWGDTTNTDCILDKIEVLLHNPEDIKGNFGYITNESTINNVNFIYDQYYPFSRTVFGIVLKDVLNECK
jgi:hypothetical protein